ncbi:MAG: hypothetical protein MJZ67_03090 [Bacteroidales bacterium]|nr:hypothetical protein [Bacteroidales bacterium]
MESLLSQRLGIKEVKSLAKAISAETLWHLMQEPDDVVSRNAAWVMTHKPDHEVSSIPQKPLIDLAISTPSEALRRLSLALILRQPIPKENLRTDFLDFCLQHMVSLEEPCGVQALCMKLAHEMCQFYPELSQEFKATINMMPTEHYKPGVKHLISKYKQ